MLATSLLLGFCALSQAVSLLSLGNTSYNDTLTWNTAGFEDAAIHPSREGGAMCVSGTVPVTASATNLRLNFQLPLDQTQVTQAFVNFVTSGYPIADLVTGTLLTSGTYDIGATLCMPGGLNNIESATVQFLTHGVGFDRYYWDFAPGYSFVDYAATQGYATFFYDRLGVGISQKADPINEIQTPLELAIAVELIAHLRTGTLGGMAFKNVVGVGHSFGSLFTQAITASSPQSLDAAILTGFTTNWTDFPLSIAGSNFAIAAENNPHRFSNLSSGYVVISTAISNQIIFFHAPGFDPSILAAVEAQKATITIGELFSLGAIGGVADNYTGSIAVVNGAFDLPFCSGNCNYPMDLGITVIPALYSKVGGVAGSTYLQPDAGHALNLHYSAHDGYAFVQDFVRRTGF